MKQSVINAITSGKEVELAKRLVSDDPQERNDCLKEIEDLISKSKIKPGQYRRIAKGLFYGLWTTDKVKVQMDVAMKIAKIVHLFEPFPNEDMLQWVSSCFEVFHREWDKIDYWRTSKFLSLARFCLNEVYVFLEGRHWNGKLVKQWNQVFIDSIVGEKLQMRSTGLALHIFQVFIETLLELNDPPYKVLKTLLDPFVDLLVTAEDKTFKRKIIEFVFRGLITNLKEGNFTHFEAEKYAAYLLKRASSKEISDPNRKFIYSIQKEFLTFVAPENPMMVNLSLDDDGELEDDYIYLDKSKNSKPDGKSSPTKARNSPVKEKNTKAEGKTSPTRKPEKPKLEIKISPTKRHEKIIKNDGKTSPTKRQEKNLKNEGKTSPTKRQEQIMKNEQHKKSPTKTPKNEDKSINEANKVTEDKSKLNKKLAKKEQERKLVEKRNGKKDLEPEIEGEEDWEDFEQEEQEEEEDEPIVLKGNKKQKKELAANNKDKKNGKENAKDKEKKNQKNTKNELLNKRTYEELQEDDEEDDLEEMDEDDEDMDELPEDWDEELMDDDMEEFDDEDEEGLTKEEFQQLVQQGLLGNLPEYLFQTKKQKKMYFDNKNKEYYTKLEKEQNRKLNHSRKVNFNLNKNQIKEFDKKNKVTTSDIELERSSPKLNKKTGILKKVSTISKDGKILLKKSNKKKSKKKVKF